MERLIDMAARKLGIDPKEIRLRNLVPPDEFPYKIGSGIVWDKSGFVEGLEAACDEIDYDGAARASRPQARAAGRWFGIGIACYAELTGIGSRISVAPGMPINTGTETATIRIDSTGAVTAAFGIASHGQGLETTLAQVIAEHLGAASRTSASLQGDSAAVPGGTGTYASRSTVLAGGAARLASEALREKVLNVASHLLEAAPADLVAERWARHGRRHRSRGDVPRGRARGLFRDGAPAAGGARGAGGDQDLRSGVRHHHVGDAHRGAGDRSARPIEVRIDRFVVAEDCGRIINPLIVDGQVHGGVAQGIGAALYEEIVYDDAGPAPHREPGRLPGAGGLRDPADARSCISRPSRRPRSAASAAWAKVARSARRRRSPTRIADALVAARDRDQRASRHAGAPVPPDRRRRKATD